MRKVICFAILTGLLIIVFAGCESSSAPYLHRQLSEAGTWTGEAASITLYEGNGHPVQGLCVIINPKRMKKLDLISNRPVLVNTNMSLIDFHSYIGKILVIKGIISKENPINPSDGERLFSVPNVNSNPHVDVLWASVDVLRIDPIQIRLLSQSTNNLLSK